MKQINHFLKVDSNRQKRLLNFVIFFEIRPFIIQDIYKNPKKVIFELGNIKLILSAFN